MNKLSKGIYYIDALAGSGKTHFFINEIIKDNIDNYNIAYLSPTLDLANETYEKVKEQYPQATLITSEGDYSESVPKRIIKQFNNEYKNKIIIMTHQGWNMTKEHLNKEGWLVFHDEINEPIRHYPFQLNSSIKDNFINIMDDVTEGTDHMFPYKHVIFQNKEKYKQIAHDGSDDLIYNMLKPIATDILNDNKIYLNEMSYNSIMNGSKSARLDFFVIDKEHPLEGTEVAIYASALFELTPFYNYWKDKIHFNKINFKGRYNKHQTPVTFHYVYDGHFSKGIRNTTFNVYGNKVPMKEYFINHIQKAVDNNPFIYLVNKDMEKEFQLIPNGNQLPHNPHGLNIFTKYNHFVCMTSYLYSDIFTQFLNKMGLNDTYDYNRKFMHIYQGMMRGSVRNNTKEKFHVYLPDKKTAQELIQYFDKNSKLNCIGDKSINESINQIMDIKDISWSSEKERNNFRKKHNRLHQLYKEELSRVPDTLYRCPTGTCEEQVNKITVFLDTYRKLNDVMETESWDQLVKEFHKQSTKSFDKKEDQMLFTAASFDLSTQGKQHKSFAKVNITYVSYLVFDIDNGSAKPEDWHDLLKDYNYLIYSSYSNSKEEPKYRVVIDVNRPMKTEEAEYILQYLADQINGAYGYTVDMKCLDAGHVFYLPSKGKNPDDAFFMANINKKPLDVDNIIGKTKEHKAIKPEQYYNNEKKEVKPIIDNVYNRTKERIDNITKGNRNYGLLKALDYGFGNGLSKDEGIELAMNLKAPDFDHHEIMTVVNQSYKYIHKQL